MSHEDLVLPTPERFSAFPYEPPYSIQIDLMKHVYSSIERRHVTIVESPTGTVRAELDHGLPLQSLTFPTGKNSESPLLKLILAHRRKRTCAQRTDFSANVAKCG